eukprot:c18129_g1_i1.p1 GENE.c18129_g1_i1~~c18129_g1_i1.p1  ORF type:complete len:625 (+),score=230.65 c18129_g1_i1:41-1876(+)
MVSQTNSRKNSKVDLSKPQYPDPLELGQQLIQEGWPVPGFLLFPGDPRHVRPLVAISVLGKILDSAGVSVEPYVYYPPEDERHVPPHIAALARQRKLWEIQNLHPHPRSQTWNNFMKNFNYVWTPIQYIIGTILSITAICVVFFAIHSNYTKNHLTPVSTGILLVILLIIIAYSEGYHVTIITLEKADSEVFRYTHPRAYRAHKMANKNAESFVVGRQVLLTGIVFCVAEVTLFDIPADVDWLFFPGEFLNVVTKSGVAVSLIVLAFGQLLPQLIATAYPIYHMSLYGGNVIIWFMLFLDRIGIANVGFWGAYAWRYLAGIMVNEEFGVGGEVVFGVDKDGAAKSTPAEENAQQKKTQNKGKDVVQNAKNSENEANAGAEIGQELTAEIYKRVRKDPVEIAKFIFSTCLLLGTFAVALMNVINGQSNLSGHPALLLVVYFILLTCMFYLEGMNLAVLALEKVPNEQIALINPGAMASHRLIHGDNGEKVKKFLLGRQFCVVWMDFLISNITGLWGLAITVFLAQVMSQIIAATNPAYFMALPGSRFMLLLSFSVEKLGVCHFGWFLGEWFTWMGETIGVLKPEPFSVGAKVVISSGAGADGSTIAAGESIP